MQQKNLNFLKIFNFFLNPHDKIIRTTKARTSSAVRRSRCPANSKSECVRPKARRMPPRKKWQDLSSNPPILPRSASSQMLSDRAGGHAGCGRQAPDGGPPRGLNLAQDAPLSNHLGVARHGGGEPRTLERGVAVSRPNNRGSPRV